MLGAWGDSQPPGRRLEGNPAVSGATVSGWHRRGTLTAGAHSHWGAAPSRGRRAGRPSIILTLAAPLPPLSRLRGADERTRYGRGRGRGGVIGDRGSPNCRPAAAAPAQGPKRRGPHTTRGWCCEEGRGGQETEGCVEMDLLPARRLGLRSGFDPPDLDRPGRLNRVRGEA